jgi:hypothetical protein
MRRNGRPLATSGAHGRRKTGAWLGRRGDYELRWWSYFALENKEKWRESWRRDWRKKWS